MEIVSTERYKYDNHPNTAHHAAQPWQGNAKLLVQMCKYSVDISINIGVWTQVPALITDCVVLGVLQYLVLVLQYKLASTQQ